MKKIMLALLFLGLAYTGYAAESGTYTRISATTHTLVTGIPSALTLSVGFNQDLTFSATVQLRWTLAWGPDADTNYFQKVTASANLGALGADSGALYVGWAPTNSILTGDWAEFAGTVGVIEHVIPPTSGVYVFGVYVDGVLDSSTSITVTDPTRTITPTITPSSTITATPSFTPTRTVTPSRTVTITISPTRTRTATRTSTITKTVTISPTPVNTKTITRTSTPSRTITMTPTATFTKTPGYATTRTVSGEIIYIDEQGVKVYKVFTPNP
jgi:hypothetical protein